MADSQESESSPTLAFTDNAENLSTQPGLVSQACDPLLLEELRQEDLEFKGGLTVQRSKDGWCTAHCI